MTSFTIGNFDCGAEFDHHFILEKKANWFRNSAYGFISPFPYNMSFSNFEVIPFLYLVV